MQDYYLQHEPFQTQHKGLAAVSTTAMSIMLIGSPFISLTLQRFPNLRRVGGCLGLAIMFSGLHVSCAPGKFLLFLSVYFPSSATLGYIE